MKKELEKKLRKYFDIPDNKELKWGLIVERFAGEDMARPALFMDFKGHKLAIDILQARFITASAVLGCTRKIVEAEVCNENESEIELVDYTEGYSTTLTEQDFYEVYFVRRFSRALATKVARGENVI